MITTVVHKYGSNGIYLILNEDFESTRKLKMETSPLYDTKSKTPWKNGHYRSSFKPSELRYIEGENISIVNATGKPTTQNDSATKGTIRFGQFEVAPADVAEMSGKQYYNVEILFWSGASRTPGVVNEDGTRIYIPGMCHDVVTLDWMTEQKLSDFLKSGDPYDAIPHNYKVQPENQGKLIWISGAPGSGKSTCGMYMSRKEGYVYYEADAFMSHLNPYVPTNVDEPTLATFSQNFLMGVPQERIDIAANARLEIVELLQGKEYDFDKLDKLCKFYTILSEDIKREQSRIGGHFAVAHAVPKRKFRDHIRNILGSELIFVVLHMTKENQIKRIRARHGNEQGNVHFLTKCYDAFEPAADDEPNTISVVINEDMTRDDVANKILEQVSYLLQTKFQASYYEEYKDTR